MQHRRVDAARPAARCARVSWNASASGMSSPAEPRRAHVDGDQSVAVAAAAQQARPAVSIVTACCAGLAEAGGRRRSAKRCRRFRPRRRRGSRCACATSAACRGLDGRSAGRSRCRSWRSAMRARRRASSGSGAAAGVEHDEIVAEPVHLPERRAGKCGHDRGL